MDVRRRSSIVIRGGSWSNLPVFVRSAARSGSGPDGGEYDYRAFLASASPARCLKRRVANSEMLTFDGYSPLPIRPFPLFTAACARIESQRYVDIFVVAAPAE